MEADAEAVVLGESADNIREDALLADVQTPADYSSRASTMSPGLRSNLTTGTSPISSGPGAESDSSKFDHLTGNDASDAHAQLCLQSNFARPVRNCPQRSALTEPASVDGGSSENSPFDDDAYAPSMGYDFPTMRTKPFAPSSFLRPGSRFHGTQQSERQVYDVQVEIKQVDMKESFLCGYLRIQGLTEDHPTLTTYFEGEIIGSKYGFYTQHEDWGANQKVDLSHWSKFPAFKQFSDQARRGPVRIKDVHQNENIFMRWKEHFLVPDHRVKTITGASFEGFYYICFNQVKGEVSGIYFHSKSEKYQRLQLKHVPDRGCFASMEFR